MGENIVLFLGLINGDSNFIAVSKINSDLDEKLSMIYLYVF